MLNRVLHLHRTAAADAFVREVAATRRSSRASASARARRSPTGAGPRPRRSPSPRAPRTRRAAALRPQERLAALLGGRDAPLAAEELALRARADLDAGRRREAALQLRIALEAALAELEPWRRAATSASAWPSCATPAAPSRAAANAALQGGIDDDDAAAVEHVLARLEAALRARASLGFD